jgi:hypothetical protein
MIVERNIDPATIAALTFLLWNYFRSWPGVWVPVFSAILSAVWALGLLRGLGHSAFFLGDLVRSLPWALKRLYLELFLTLQMNLEVVKEF